MENTVQELKTAYIVTIKCQCNSLVTKAEEWTAYPDPVRMACPGCGTIYMLAKLRMKKEIKK